MATPANIATLSRFLAHTDANGFTDAQILLLANNEYERLNGILQTETAGGRWKFGDISYTAFPSYLKNLTSGTAAYEIDFSATDNTLNPAIILGVEIQDQDGNYHPIDPITIKEINEQGFSQSDFMETNGRPIYYEKREHMLVLYPAPDNGVSVTLTNGLRIFFLRGANILADVTATNRQIGLPIAWQDAIAWGVAYVYAAANGMANALLLKGERNEKVEELLKFIGVRDQGNRPIMTNKFVQHI